MARLKSYLVTSYITPEEIEEEVVSRLQTAEDITHKDHMALTFNYHTRQLYWIISDGMVEKDKKIDLNMLEIKADTRVQDAQIAKINRILKTIIESDGGIIGNKGQYSYYELLNIIEEQEKIIEDLRAQLEDLKNPESGLFTPHKVYYGFVEEKQVPKDQQDIENLQFSKILRSRVLTWEDIDMINKRLVYVYPKEFGELEAIVDRNGLDYIQTFKKEEILINKVVYYMYILPHAVSIEDSILTFS